MRWVQCKLPIWILSQFTKARETFLYIYPTIYGPELHRYLLVTFSLLVDLISTAVIRHYTDLYASFVSHRLIQASYFGISITCSESKFDLPSNTHRAHLTLYILENLYCLKITNSYLSRYLLLRLKCPNTKLADSDKYKPSKLSRNTV